MRTYNICCHGERRQLLCEYSFLSVDMACAFVQYDQDVRVCLQFIGYAL